MAWGRISRRRLAATLLTALSLTSGGATAATTAAAADVSTSSPVFRAEADAHLGVASCASSVCHGKLTVQEDRNVWLNEYHVWSNEDPHANAWRTLTNESSQRMARKLGLESAATADICLDCHADNVPAAQRGPKFQISDGVGCEACHGGSERWIETHTEADASHADNVARGLYALEQPEVRAGVCVSCHLGTGDQFATHEIMAAGHPRLLFELEAFTANQSAHFAIDDDYRARKGQGAAGFQLWLTGQLESARRYLELLGSDMYQPGGLFPELAFYDCHSCHHGMQDVRWSRDQAGADVPPGSVRLQDQHLRVLEVVARVLDPAQAQRFDRAVADLIVAGQRDAAAVHAAAAELLAWLDVRQRAWSDASFGREQARQVRAALIEEAAAGRLADFVDAEQVFLAVEGLSLYLDDADEHQQALDALFQAVQDDERYRPEAFRRAASSARSDFR